MGFFQRLYFHCKPLIPSVIRIEARRWRAQRILARSRDVWPIDTRAKNPPEGWRGWPEKKKFAFVLTHDVERSVGLSRVYELMKLEESAGFRSSFNFVPEGEYSTPPGMRQSLEKRGFEVGVHDLKHDGKLYNSREGFQRNAAKINGYLKEWNSVGFRSAFMYHNLDWLHDLNVFYDSSTFDCDVFEPQPDGVQTIFPFWSAGASDGTGYVELPSTLPQDSTLFLILQERTIEIWKQKLDWIAEHGGMALLNVHPDYICFSGAPDPWTEFPAKLYRDFLMYVREKYANEFWHPLPREAAEFFYQSLDNKDQHGCESVEADGKPRLRVASKSRAAHGMIAAFMLSNTVNPFLGELLNYL